MKIKTILLPTLVLFLVCGITTGLLSLTNSFTKDKIEATRQQAMQDSMKQLVPGGTFTSLNEEQTVYSAKADGKDFTIIITSAKGYKSDVEVMTALDTNGTVTGVIVTGCADESPGIGQKVGIDQSFINQFIGRSEQSDTVDAITGATISSKAVNNAVNMAVEQYNTLKGGATNEK